MALSHKEKNDVNIELGQTETKRLQQIKSTVHDSKSYLK